MGEVFARVVLGLAKPRVGLLNVGSEELKGHDAVRGAAAMLRESRAADRLPRLRRGHDITAGMVDVVVTDGFTGNVALKIAEGTAAMFTAVLRDAFRSGAARQDRLLFAAPGVRRCCASGSTRAATTAPCSSASTASW